MSLQKAETRDVKLGLYDQKTKKADILWEVSAPNLPEPDGFSGIKTCMENNEVCLRDNWFMLGDNFRSGLQGSDTTKKMP